MHDEFFKFWENAAKNYQKAFESYKNFSPQSMQNATPETMMSSFMQAGQPFLDMMQKWYQEMSKLHMNQGSEEYLRHKNQQMFGLMENIDQKMFDVLSKMTAENMADSYQKTLDKMGNASKQFDMQTMMDYLQTITTEYLRDIEAIPENAKKINVEHLWEIWTKMLANPNDEEMKTYSKRLQESLAVKLKYGMEYYADPEKTKVGFSPRNLVWKKDKYQLFHYPAVNPKKNTTPVLIVYSLINKPYILDLLPGCSFIEYLTKEGLDVYLIDWGEPDYDDRKITLDHLISPVISGAVDFVVEYSKSEKVSILGHCIGGILATLYAARYPEKVERLVTLTTPISGTDGGIVGLWAHLLPTEQILQTFGNMPAKLIRYTFIGLKPYYEVIRWKKFYENLDKMNEQAMTAFCAVDKWINDNIDVPGEVFRKFILEIYQENRLSKGQTNINGKNVSLANITCPLYNVIAEDDWIVTPPSAKVLNDNVASEVNIQKIIPGQHLSIIFHPKNRPVWKEMLDFFCGDVPQEKKATSDHKSQQQKKNATVSKKLDTQQKEINLMRMQDRVVMITGGARGIGRATVLKFASEGAKVCWCDLDGDANKALHEELGSENHSYHHVNVTDRNAVREWVQQIVDKHGRIDVLVNNAGITRDNFLVKVKNGELVKEMPEEEFDQVIDINLKGVFNCTQAVAPVMIKQESGVILSASSVVGLYGNIGQTNYVATKAGVIGMTQVWARELGRYNIRVNAVSPGFIATEMVKKIPEKIIAGIAGKTPMNRLGEPRELANVYLWLASDEASFVSGANISVDGGLVWGT
ncbi:3-oxoacyl-ACP reductase FabG [Candidatus Uabimicrobium amorphum]|uniref:3-oxoacyl-[acyl-carrier-protein] reductase FabG n=1 Tax=Uabimicrobium amorphum TaxID=2596890 RepID=A0A5S9F5M3_UABAM|nr:3-oxoacyl-ACP reductase FabG [Candidatus Uabimicrobium amorphum]BBM85422.1 3-oxoacyl-[acyl-carrier-protein] reductase FabG [Candidatus Uabimicrobium amorphum]